MTHRWRLSKWCPDESPANRSTPPGYGSVKNAALVAVFALPLILAAFAAGWTLSGSGPKRPGPEPPTQQSVAFTTPAEEAVPRAIPGEDVPGKDLAGLPRYPGSTRVVCRHEEFDGIARTRAEYATDGDPIEILALIAVHSAPGAGPSPTSASRPRSGTSSSSGTNGRP